MVISNLDYTKTLAKEDIVKGASRSVEGDGNNFNSDFSDRINNRLDNTGNIALITNQESTVEDSFNTILVGDS
jgi:hypothetical protein